MKRKKMLFFTVLLVFLWGTFSFKAEARAEEEEKTYKLEPIFISGEDNIGLALRQAQYLDNPGVFGEQVTPELFKHFSNVDISRRGVFGTQSDVQIRGSGYEQTDIFINGIKVNDPQTGHFNTDIPLFSEDIEKIVTIAGPSASIYAGSSQGGSLHLLTKAPDKEFFKTKSIIGEHNFFSQEFSGAYFIGPLRSRSTLGKTTCDGYRYNSDFESLGFSHVSGMKTDYGDADLSFYFLDKEFGANGFYSEFYPEQREHTKTIFTSLGLKIDAQDYYLNPKVYLRRHHDRYFLDRTRPGWNENLHTNYVRGLNADSSAKIGAGEIFCGFDAAEERIDSTNIGTHQRTRNTLYSKYDLKIDKILFNTGVSGLFYEGLKNKFVPDIGAGYYLSDELKIRGAFSRSFRPPTFTELYYKSPSNNGNENLMPEDSQNYEAGIDYKKSESSYSAVFFDKKDKNAIDWVREPQATVYQAQNVSKVKTKGAEFNLKYAPKESKSWKSLSCGYTVLKRKEEENNLVSKYVFDYLKHKITLDSEQEIPFNLNTNIFMTYQQRSNKGGDFIFDAKVSRRIKQCLFFLKIDNIFNHAYSEKGNIPMPGRWTFLGVEVEW